MAAAPKDVDPISEPGPSPTLAATNVSETHAVPIVNPSPPRPVNPALAPVPAQEPSPSVSAAIGAEVALLGQANGEMQAGRASQALALLDEHVRRFPSGALAEERQAARILALCAVGRADESREARGQFLREHPQSPQVARVRGACNEGVPTEK